MFSSEENIRRMTAEQAFGAIVGRDDPLANFKMHAVIELGEGAVKVPSEGEALVFIFLEAAEFPDQINFELGADPHAEFKSDIGMGAGAAVASGSGFKADGVGFLNPFLHADLVTVEPSLTSNCGEFAIIKSGIESATPKYPGTRRYSDCGASPK